MDNNNTILTNNDELNALREQMAQLKQRLDCTTTLNEKLMVDAIKSKMRSMHKTIYMVLGMGLLTCPLWLVISIVFNLSWYFIAFTLVMLLASATSDYLINRMDCSLIDHDLAETARQLVRMKKLRLRAEIIGVAVVIVWFAWAVCEFMHAIQDKTFAIIMVASLAVGFVIGGIVGIRIFLKLQRDNDEMMRQINELQKEAE